MIPPTRVDIEVKDNTQEQIIGPSSGWQLVNWRELIAYKDLLYFLTLRGVKARYAQSALGVGWAIIQPLFTTLVFTVIFGNFASISSDGVPYIIFSLAGMVPWSYFSNSLTESSTSLVQNANLITKVYFPRLVLPLSVALSKLIDFVIGLIVLAGFMAYFQIIPTINVIFLPILIMSLLMSSLGLGMILSAMAVQYRDVKHATSFIAQLLLYLAPVVYPTSEVPAKWIFWYSLNPMVGVLEGFRAALLDTLPMPWVLIGRSIVVSFALFIFGTFYFRRMEKIFADVA